MDKKITSIEEFQKAKDSIKKAKQVENDKPAILLCAGASCIASGALEIKDALETKLKEHNLDISIVETGCLGPCSKGPVILIKPDGVIYERLKVEDVEKIVVEHLKQSKIVEELTYKNIGDDTPVLQEKDAVFLEKQTKIVLRNSGKIDPLKIEDYLSVNGYESLSKVLLMDQDSVIEEMKHSGLRGRGGAGFPTYLKWQFTKNSPGEQKYVLCNADEGDPGAFMDRSVIEGDPHSLIEGMAIAAYAIGANQGYVYVRAEYPLAVSRLKIALEQAREAGILGKNIFGKGFDFDLEIRMGSGAFVCGEETALINSIEGKRGEPRPRPPFPAQKGLWGKPTVLNNVETYANVPVIFDKGAGWFASFGTEKSKGTKVFALAGSVKNTGLVEVPIGTPLGELIYDIGGGIVNDRDYKAAQIGGPSGGCIPKQHLNVLLDYDSLNELGAIMGSGGLIVMDDTACMVDVARFFLEFVQEESCGKCVPCRVGTKRMLEMLERICSGQGEMSDIDKLIELGEQIKDTSLCGLGQTAPNPVLSTIRHFKEEYIEHIRDKHCQAGVCPELVRAPCQSSCPANVDIPGFVSLVGNGKYEEALMLHRERNPFASVCARVCFHTCEDKCRRTSLDSAVSIRGVKRFMVDTENKMIVPEVRENAENATKKIAIIGGGPAGLSCAYFLARLGYKPVVFEALERPGGMLVQTIPAYRLPRETLAKEIRMIEDLGVDIQTNKALGKDFTIESLKQEGYDSIFIGVGAPDSYELGIEGEDADGVVSALDFLKQYNVRGAVPVGKKVVVVGGGNAAVDAARTSLRLGAEEVTIVYRRTQNQMPAYDEEIEEAINEGVKIMPLTHPLKIDKQSDNKFQTIRCMKMKLGDYDKSGRRRPTVSDENIIKMEADQVIVAIGQSLDTDSLLENSGIQVTKNKFISVDPVTQQTSIEGVFAGGDAAIGPDSVVSAIAAGEKAAVAMDNYLTGDSHDFWRADKIVDVDYDPDADPVPYAREPLKLIDVEKRKHNFAEVEVAWNESVARRQAKRCLRCDYGKTKCDKGGQA